MISKAHLTLAAIEKPAELIMITGNTNGDSNIRMSTSIITTTVANRTQGLYAGHINLTANFLFCDGHVKPLRPTLTVPGTTFNSTSDNFWAFRYPTANTDYFDADSTSRTAMQTAFRNYMSAVEDAWDQA